MLPVIPITLARAGSKRLPNKNLRQICGKPLISYTIEASVKALGSCYVSTDSESIAGVARKAGGTVLKRPAALAQDSTGASEVLKHVFTQQLSYPDAIVVFLNTTSPLRTAADIRGALDLFEKTASASVLSGFRCPKFFWKKEEGVCHPINYSTSSRPRTQDMDALFQENGAIYISTLRYILDHDGNWLDNQSMVYEMPEYRSFEVDTLEDLRLCEAILKERKERISYEEDSLSRRFAPGGRLQWSGEL